MLTSFTVKADNYFIKYMDNPHEPGHTIPVARITPTTPREIDYLGEVAPGKTIDIALPIFTELGDYTQWNKKYDLLVIGEQGKKYFADTDQYTIAIPIAKTLGQYKASIEQSNQPSQLLNSSTLSDNYRIMKSEDGSSYLGLSNDAVVLKTGNILVTLAADAVTITGKIVEHSFPKTNRLIMEETGIMRILPKCFLPPFSIPDYLPNMDLIGSTMKIYNAVKKIKSGGK